MSHQIILVSLLSFKKFKEVLYISYTKLGTRLIKQNITEVDGKETK